MLFLKGEKITNLDFLKLAYVLNLLGEFEVHPTKKRGKIANKERKSSKWKVQHNRKANGLPCMKVKGDHKLIAMY